MLNPQNEPLFSSYDSETLTGRFSRWWKHNVTEYFSPPETPTVVKATHPHDTFETPIVVKATNSHDTFETLLVVKATHPHDTFETPIVVKATNSHDTFETLLVVKATHSRDTSSQWPMIWDHPRDTSSQTAAARPMIWDHPRDTSSQTAAARPMIWDPRKLFTDFIKTFTVPETPLYFDVLENPEFAEYCAWRAQIDLKNEFAERVFCQDLIWMVIQFGANVIQKKELLKFFSNYENSVDESFFTEIKSLILKFQDEANSYFKNHSDKETGTLFITLPNTMVRSVIAKINASFDHYEKELSIEEIDENEVEEKTFYQAAKESLQAGYHVLRKHPWKVIGAIASTAAIIYAGKRSDSTNFNPLTALQFPQWAMPSWQMTNTATVFALSMASGAGREFAVPSAFAGMMFSMLQSVKADLTTGLVAHYPFDGDANDIWGGNNATLFNGPTFVPGKLGQAINFDGIDDYAKGLADNFPTAERTIAFWFYTDFPLLHQGLFGYGGGDSCGKTLMIIMNNLDAPDALDVQSHCRTNRLLYVYNTTPPVGRWVHAAVRVSINGTCWFVDGQNKICNSNYITSTNVTGKDFSFGCVVNVQGFAPYADGYSGYFQGMLDEFRIYSRALNDAEIRELFTGLVAHYPFDGDANDVSGNGNHAALFNGTTFAPGKFNQAITFDGIGNFARGDCSNFPTAERTIAFWAFRNFSIPAANAFGYGGDSSCLKSFFIVLGDNQLIVPRHCDSNPFVSHYNTSGLTNRWFHIAVRTGTEDTCFFLNGQLNSCNNTVFTNTGVLGKQFGFGAIPDGLGYVPFPDPRAYFQGMLDEFYIFSRALNDTAIRNLYNLGVTTSTSSTSITTSSSSSTSITSVITTSSSFFSRSRSLSTSQNHFSSTVSNSENASGSGLKILMLVLPIGGGSLLAMIVAGLVYGSRQYRKNKADQNQFEMQETPSAFPNGDDHQVTADSSQHSEVVTPSTQKHLSGTEYANRPSQPEAQDELPPDYANSNRVSVALSQRGLFPSQYGKTSSVGDSDLPEDQYSTVPRDDVHVLEQGEILPDAITSTEYQATPTREVHYQKSPSDLRLSSSSESSGIFRPRESPSKV